MVSQARQQSRAAPVARTARPAVGRLLRATLFYLVLSLGALAMALPMIWMVTTSFKLESQVFAVPIRWWPSPFQPDNYVRAWAMANWGLYFFNSFLVAIATTLLNVFFSSLAGYGFAKYRF